MCSHAAEHHGPAVFGCHPHRDAASECLEGILLHVGRVLERRVVADTICTLLLPAWLVHPDRQDSPRDH
jgi:hypothetical protein